MQDIKDLIAIAIDHGRTPQEAEAEAIEYMQMLVDKDESDFMYYIESLPPKQDELDYTIENIGLPLIR